LIIILANYERKENGAIYETACDVENARTASLVLPTSETPYETHIYSAETVVLLPAPNEGV